MALSLLSGKRFNITLERLCRQIIEEHDDLNETILIGMQPRGIYLAKALHERLSKQVKDFDIKLGSLDITFYRDDFRRRTDPIIPSDNQIDFLVEDKKVILIDDVLYTGRSVRAALDALLAYGRPKKVEFLTLVDRRYARQLPIEPDYVGMSVDTRAHQKVKVEWEETEGSDTIWLIDLKKEEE